MRGRVEIGVLAIGVVLALFTGWAVFFADLGDNAAAGAAPGDEGESWIVVDQGRRVASASPRPAGSPSPSPSFTFAPQATPTAAPSPTGACEGVLTFGQIAGLTVEAGAGTATVSWFNPGDPDLVEYKLTAIPQVLVTGQQPELVWETVAPGAPCRTLTATVTGLDRNAPYMFSVDAVSKAYNSDGNRTVTVARSGVTYTG